MKLSPEALASLGSMEGAYVRPLVERRRPFPAPKLAPKPKPIPGVAAALDAKIAALTPEQIVAAFRKNLELGGFSYFKAGDFKKAAAAAK